MHPRIDSLHLCLSEKFSGLIWKVEIHKAGVLGIETRNMEHKQVYFSAFNYVNGETYFKEKVFEEKWNLSLAFAGERNLILSAREH